MKLWIRTQNRWTLIKCNQISIAPGNRILGYFDKETEYETLGVYKTESRALQVLDEIQKFMQQRIENTYATKKTENDIGDEIKYFKEMINPNCIVFEMPLE